jgi:hypothetical protein
MTLPAWHEEPIERRHDRKSFDCGDAALNEFLQRYARQSHELGAAKTILAIDDADNRTIVGFYSLAPGALAYAETPEIAGAARRCLRAAAEVGGVILIIDAKGERAADWYAGYGAVPLKQKPLTLVMSLATFAADLKAKGHL